MCRIAGTIVCLQALLMWSTHASAQVYIGGALAGSSFDVNNVRGGSASTSFDNTSADSMVRGVVAEAGWMVSPSRSIGVEVTVPSGRSTIAHDYHYLFGPPFQSVARYREHTFFGVVRAQMTTWGRVRVDLAGGVGFVRGSNLSRTSVWNSLSQTFGPFSQEREVTRVMTGLTGGADVAIDIIPRVSVVPQFRMLVIGRGGPQQGRGSSFGTLGLPTVTYRLAIGIRAEF